MPTGEGEEPRARCEVRSGTCLFARDFGLSARDREHDPQPHGDDQPDHDPGGGHVLEHAAVPEGGERTDQKDEVADQVHVDEAHGHLRWQVAVGGEGFTVRSGFPDPTANFKLRTADYRVSRTMSAARRFRRRVSSRALSYFGRSSPCLLYT